LKNTKEKTNNIGIYKITSPTGRVYIGQSSNLKYRLADYYKLRSKSKKQVILYNSFLKYGVENHQFDIIEYCTIDELYCSERFWQDEFDVLNGGLNCILTSCDDKKAQMSEETKSKISKAIIAMGRAGKPDYSKRKVILCLRTGIFYYGAEEVAKAKNISKSMVWEHLTRLKTNKLDLIYV